MTLRPGQRFGDYRIEEELQAGGGMGSVYRATLLRSGRVCAIKIVRPELAGEDSYRARFDREARMLKALNHRNIVPILDAAEVDGIAYIATKFIVAGDLRKLLESELDAATVLSVFEQACAGVHAAHQLEIVHRDVKPANLLVEWTDDGVRIFVADFGVAIGGDFATRYTAVGGAVGTPGFMAPECQRGDATDYRADIYSLGCCLATLIGPRNSRGPIREVIARATSLFPADRHSSAMELYADAARVLGPMGTRVLPARPAPLPDDTRMDTSATDILGPRQQGRARVVDRVMEQFGPVELVESSCLARSRSDPRLVTAVLTSRNLDGLRPHGNALALALATELGVERVQMVVMPAGKTLQETVVSYLGGVFAERALPDDFASLRARRSGDLLEIDLPPRLDRLCDEDALVPLVAHLGVKRVRLNPIHNR